MVCRVMLTNGEFPREVCLVGQARYDIYDGVDGEGEISN